MDENWIRIISCIFVTIRRTLPEVCCFQTEKPSNITSDLVSMKIGSNLIFSTPSKYLLPYLVDHTPPRCNFAQNDQPKNIKSEELPNAWKSRLL